MLALALAAALQPGLWLDVPFVAQEKDGCGAAAVAMVMEYWGRRVEPAEVYRALYSPSAHGTFAAGMAGYLERHGFRVFRFHSGLSDLREDLSKGRPLIVALRGAPLHYVVVAGLDRGVVLVNDPERRKLFPLDEAAFERDWHGHWTLLAVPR